MLPVGATDAQVRCDAALAQPGLRELHLAVDPSGEDDALAALLERARGRGLPRDLRRLLVDRRAYWDALAGDDEVVVAARDGQARQVAISLDDPARRSAAALMGLGLDLLQGDARGADPGEPAAEAVDAGAHASARVLSLSLSARGRVELDPLVRMIAAAPTRRALRELSVGLGGGARDHVQWIHTSEVPRLLAACPSLRSLTLPMAELEVASFDHPALRELRLGWLGTTPYGPSDLSTWGRGAVPKGSGLAFLRRARLPALEALGLDFQYDWYVRWELADALHALHAEGMPRLRHLTLRYFEYGDELCEALPHCPLAGQLVSLNLVGSEPSARGIAALLAHRGAFPALRELHLVAAQEAPRWEELRRTYPVVVAP
ncbi:MAG: hypothetical protein R3B48_17930 [Kofleriaceae bacterium]